MRTDAPPEWQQVRMAPYQPARSSTPGIHPWLSDFETKAIRGEAAYRAAKRLDAGGFRPDVIVAHPGWGESLFLKEVWPRARLGVYCEFFYRSQGADVGFDPEFPPSDDEACRVRMKNLNNLAHLDHADAGLSPTLWQASTFPQWFRDRITVAHDGIDTRAVAPDPAVSIRLATEGGPLVLNRRDEVITFINRNLEPYRGYHIFMRALPEILERRPNARVLMIGGDDVSYGARPPEGRKWKEIFLSEVRDRIGGAALRRIHFLGHVPYRHFIPLLQLSTVHVYLTYPFVLSWSLLEAMSAGCAIVASDTPPLHEAIRDNDTGLLVPFFDTRALADRVCGLLGNPAERARLGANARAFAQASYDLRTTCLPAQMQWVMRLADVKAR